MTFIRFMVFFFSISIEIYKFVRFLPVAQLLVPIIYSKYTVIITTL